MGETLTTWELVNIGAASLALMLFGWLGWLWIRAWWRERHERRWRKEGRS